MSVFEKCKRCGAACFPNIAHYCTGKGEGEGEPDMVNQPPHYTSGGVECIDALRAALTEDEFRGFCKGNAIKYLWRSNLKGSSAQDLEKAVWYTRMANGDDPRAEYDAAAARYYYSGFANAVVGTGSGRSS